MLILLLVYDGNLKNILPLLSGLYGSTITEVKITLPPNFIIIGKFITYGGVLHIDCITVNLSIPIVIKFPVNSSHCNETVLFFLLILNSTDPLQPLYAGCKFDNGVIIELK